MMSRYSVIFLALVGMLAGTGAESQSATSRVSFSIPAVLRLQTLAGDRTMTPARQSAEIDGAVVLRVTANRSWKLVAMQADGGSAPVLLRAAVGGGPAKAFRPVAPGSAVVSGGRGRDIDVIVEYRLPAGVRPIDVRYALQPAES